MYKYLDHPAVNDRATYLAEALTIPGAPPQSPPRTMRNRPETHHLRKTAGNMIQITTSPHPEKTR